MHRLTKKILTVMAAAVVFTATLLSPAVTAKAENQDFEYNEQTNTLNGTISTTGEVTRLEIYYSNGIVRTDTGMYLSQEQDFNSHVDLSSLSTDDDQPLSDNVEVFYGGDIDVPGYNLKCSSYYILSKSKDTQRFNIEIKRRENLKECFVVKSAVPSNWQSLGTPVITEPEEFLLGFIDSALSEYTTDDIVPIISQTTDIEQTTQEFEAKEPVSEEDKDPLESILKLMILVVMVAIILTSVALVKNKRKQEKERSETFVKKANEKSKNKKAKDNNDLMEFMDSYSDDYSDDEDIDDDIYGDYDADENESSVSYMQEQPEPAVSEISLPEEAVEAVHSTDDLDEDDDFSNILSDNHEPVIPVDEPEERELSAYERYEKESAERKKELERKLAEIDKLKRKNDELLARINANEKRHKELMERSERRRAEEKAEKKTSEQTRYKQPKAVKQNTPAAPVKKTKKKVPAFVTQD